MSKRLAKLDPCQMYEIELQMLNLKLKNEIFTFFLTSHAISCVHDFS